MTNTTTITPDPDGDGFILHLPEFTHLDTQVWSADVGLTAEGLAALRAALVSPAAVEQPANQTTPSHRAGLRDHIAGVLWPLTDWDGDELNAERAADAVLAVLCREWPWLRAEAEDAKPPAEAADRIAEETALSLGRDLLRDGLDAFLLRLVGPDNARRVLAEHRAADRAADAPATECSAQHRQFDDGRLCIRAAQHHGDHIDERGYHWSDTVAVYPVADGTFASRIRRDVGTMQRRMADETATETPAPDDRRLHACTEFGTWVASSVCAEPCGAMHTRCTECGVALDGCPQQPAAEARQESCAHCGQPIRRITGTLAAWWVHDPGGNTVCHPEQAASSPRATPKTTDVPAPGSTEPRPCRTFVSGGTVWCCEEGETDCPCVCHQPAVGARQDGATQ